MEGSDTKKLSYNLPKPYFKGWKGKIIKNKVISHEALKVCKRGGAGAITATSNISGKLLSFIVNNHKEESLIDNFDVLYKR